jgi:alpha-tubulin suppressor-like RCC1 family protein
MGVTSAGIAYGWGYNALGQLGDNTTVSKLSPVTVVGGITTWSEVSSGDNFNLGRTSTGIAYAWGGAFYGRLGDNTTVSKSSPVTVVGGITAWSQVSAGTSHGLGVVPSSILNAQAAI